MEENRATNTVQPVLQCLMAKTGLHKHKGTSIRDEMVFDAQTYLIAIDTGCSFCITNDDRHFVGEVETIAIPSRVYPPREVDAKFLINGNAGADPNDPHFYRILSSTKITISQQIFVTYIYNRYV
jgi:hypothetical protein